MNRYTSYKPFSSTLGGLKPSEFTQVMSSVKQSQSARLQAARDVACGDCLKKSGCHLKPRFNSACLDMEVQL